MENEEMLKLDNQLCFAVYATSRAITKMYRPLLEKLNLTYPQYLVLLVLWETDGISVKSLGKRLYLDSGTLTPLLKRMEKNGLLLRERSSDDERVVMVNLSDQGKEMKEEACEVPKALLGKNAISKEEFLGLRTTLQDLLEKLNEPEE